MKRFYSLAFIIGAILGLALGWLSEQSFALDAFKTPAVSMAQPAKTWTISFEVRDEPLWDTTNVVERSFDNVNWTEIYRGQATNIVDTNNSLALYRVYRTGLPKTNVYELMSAGVGQ